MASRSNTHFESSLEKLGRILTRDENIEVRLEGNQARTNGKIIYLPMMEDIDSELKADLSGFLDHEVAHCKFTDFDELGKPKRLINRFHKELHNAIEDSRIELLMRKEFTGCGLNLDRLNQKWSAKMEEGRSRMPWPIRLIASIREIYDNKTPKTDEQIEPVLAAIMPQCKALRSIDNTADLLDATEQLIKDINLARERLSDGLPPLEEQETDEEMRGESSVELDPDRKKKEGKTAKGNEQFDPATETEYKDEESGEDGTGDGESEDGESGESEDGSGQKDSSGENAGMSAEKEGSEKGESGLNDSDKQGNENQTGELETRKNYASWTESEDEKKMLNDKVDADSSFDKHVFSPESYMQIQLEKAIESAPVVRKKNGLYYGREDTLNSTDISLPYSRQYDEVIDFTGKGSKTEYASRKLNVMKHINPITNRLERVLKVEENARFINERERGQLNARALTKMCIDRNYKTPFKSFTKVDTTNVAVTLLIDCSGSMNGDRIEVARQTALALGESLKSLNITFEALGFNTSSNKALASIVAKLPEKEVQRFNRFGETLRLMIFKRFESQDLSGICKAQSGGANADGESIIWAAKRLALRKEKRKILIVLSDGQPSYGGANQVVLASDLKRVVKILPKSGIEAVGIGIQTEDIKIFFKDYVVVDDISTLSSKVMRKLSSILEKGLKK